MTNDGLQGLTPVEPREPAGIMPNTQHQTFHGFMTGAPYELAVVEFDDQGRCYDRGQMDAVAQRLEALAPNDPRQGGQDVILVVFVHGWQHDARSDDENLSAFRVLLSETVDYKSYYLFGQREEGSFAADLEVRLQLGVDCGEARLVAARPEYRCCCSFRWRSARRMSDALFRRTARSNSGYL